MHPHKTKHTPGKADHDLAQDGFRSFLLFMMICIMTVGVVLSDKERAREPVRFSGRPVFSAEFEDKKPYTVDQIIEAGEYLYVLPNDTDGFVQVYDLKGSYQHSLFFPEESNGVFRMAAEGNAFYFRNQSSDVFVFRDGAFLEYVPWKLARERFAHIDFEGHGSSPGYEIRGTDLWRVLEDQEELVMADFVWFDASLALACMTALLCIGILSLAVGWLKRRRVNR